MEEKVSTFTKIRAVACPMIVNLIIGSYYAYSNINPYVAKHLNSKPEDTIIVMQIWLALQSLFSIVGVKLCDRLGYWTVNYIAFVGYALLNFVVSYITDATLFVIVYSVFSGMFIGMGYLPALYTSWTYFPNKKSAVTGVILFCAGMSASILSPISTWIVNPHNLKPTDEGYGANVPFLYRCYSIYFGVLAIIACSLQPKPLISQVYTETKIFKTIVKDPTSPNKDKQEAKDMLRRMTSAHYEDEVLDQEDIQMVHKEELAAQVQQFAGEHMAVISGQIDPDRITDLIVREMKFHKIADDTVDKRASLSDEDKPRLSRLIENNAEALYKKSRQLQEQNCPSLKAGLTSSSFAFMAIMSICCSIYPYFLNSNWKTYYLGKLENIDDSKMSFILSFGAVANSSIRAIVGFLLLKLDVKVIYYCNIMLSIFGAFTIQDLLSSYETGVMYVMFAYFGLGSQVTLFPMICTKVFGSTVGPKIYPFVYLCFSISNFAQYFLYKFYGKQGHIDIMFYCFGGCAFLGAILAVMFDSRPSWANAIYKHNLEQQIDEQEAALLKEQASKKKKNVH